MDCGIRSELPAFAGEAVPVHAGAAGGTGFFDFPPGLGGVGVEVTPAGDLQSLPGQIGLRLTGLCHLFRRDGFPDPADYPYRSARL